MIRPKVAVIYFMSLNDVYAVAIFNSFLQYLVGQTTLFPERKPCPQYFDTCCSIKAEEPILPKSPIIVHDRCGIRNQNGAGFQIINKRDNEAQFGML